MSMELRFGIVVPQGLPIERSVERWRQVEALGFDQLWLPDHHTMVGAADDPWFDSWVTLGAMAHATERIRIGPMVSTPTHHNPSMFVARAMTVDHYSNGRLELGLGSGGRAVDWEEAMLGVRSWTRGQRIERFSEFLELLNLQFRNHKSSYQGRYYTTKDTVTIPHPMQQPHPPFIIAAHGPKSLKLVAQHGDGWNTYGGGKTEAEFRQAALKQSSQLDAHCTALGRDPATIRRTIHLGNGEVLGSTSMDALQAFIGTYAEFGFTEFSMYWLPEEADGRVVETAITALARLEEIALKVIPGLRTS